MQYEFIFLDIFEKNLFEWLKINVFLSSESTKFY